MRVVKKLIVLFVLLTLCIACFCGCGPGKSRATEKVTVVESASYFDDFQVKDGKVYFYCYLTLKNNSAEPAAFELKGNFQADVDGGLLKYALVDGFFLEHEKAAYVDGVDPDAVPLSDVFRLDANEEKEFDVWFIGESAGGTTKHDRLLPEIIIEYRNE